MRRSLKGPVLAVLAAAAIVAAAPDSSRAQEPGPSPRVELSGAADVALDRRLARLLDSDPLVVTSDTHIVRGDTIRRSVLVLDATLVLEGAILGDLVIVDAGAFVRPGSRVEGDLVNIAGGLYRSEIASIGGTIIDLPTAEYRVIRREDGVFVIEAWGTPSNLKLDDFMGFHPPLYDRVDGLTLVWGATYRLPRIEEITPQIHAQAGWRTERGEPTYAADLSLRRFATIVSGGYAHETDTNERWIRGDLRNALNYVWDGDDYRDYHGVDRAWVRVAHEFGDEAKNLFAVASVTGQQEEAGTLPGDEPWHLWGDSTRSNPGIDDGTITSVIGALDVEWEGLTTAFEGRISYEAARDFLGGTVGFNPAGPGAGIEGDGGFDLITATGDWAMQAFANHTLEIELHVQVPLSGDTLPRQRWSFVGGSGTLQTTGFAEFYGDRVAFVETKYIIPMPERIALPILGAPELQLVHGAGMAWLADDEGTLHQEIGVRVQFFGLYFRYMVEPEDLSGGDLDIGLSWPFGGSHAWER